MTNKDTKGKTEALIPHKVFTEICDDLSQYTYGRMLSFGDVVGISAVLNHTQSIGKYPKHSWKKVDPQLYVDAVIRHATKIAIGEKCDFDSALPHQWHLNCNLMFLLYFEMEEKND